jgi:uncharacterized protein (DUF3084 family)
MNTQLEVDGLESLSRLEDRILATVEQLRTARDGKNKAEREAASLREQLTKARSDLETLRTERKQIGERLERLLEQIDLIGRE